MIWFSADHHFGHNNIIKYCNRPFKTIEEHDHILIKNWNDLVSKNDIVYYLGDFCLAHKVDIINSYLNRLNGKKILIIGNHDRNYKHSNWEEYHHYLFLTLDNIEIQLSHFYEILRPCDVYLHGHSHNYEYGESRFINVGVDIWDFKPVSFPRIKERMNKCSTF